MSIKGAPAGSNWRYWYENPEELEEFEKAIQAFKDLGAPVSGSAVKAAQQARAELNMDRWDAETIGLIGSTEVVK